MLVVVILGVVGVALALLAWLGSRQRTRRARNALAVLRPLVGERREFGWELGVLWFGGAVSVARATLRAIDETALTAHLDDLESDDHPFVQQVGSATVVAISRLRFVADPAAGTRHDL